MTNDPSWVAPLYNVVALTGVAVVIYVMQKTEHDRINRIDPLSVQWCRRASFIGIALALCYSVLDLSWHRSVLILMLVSAGVTNLSVNALALHLRSTPGGGNKMRSSSNAVRKTLSVAYHFFSKLGHEK